MGYRSGDPEVLCTGVSLAGQLKLKWFQASVVLGLSEAEVKLVQAGVFWGYSP